MALLVANLLAVLLVVAGTVAARTQSPQSHRQLTTLKVALHRAKGTPLPEGIPDLDIG